MLSRQSGPTPARIITARGGTGFVRMGVWEKSRGREREGGRY